MFKMIRSLTKKNRVSSIVQLHSVHGGFDLVEKWKKIILKKFRHEHKRTNTKY